MKIAIISSKDSEMDVSSLLSEKLLESIAGLEVKTIIAENKLEIISEAASLENFDLIVVVLYYEKETVDVKVVMEKLIDLDLSGKKTMKFIVNSEEALSVENEVKRIAEAITDKFFVKNKDDFDEQY